MEKNNRRYNKPGKSRYQEPPKDSQGRPLPLHNRYPHTKGVPVYRREAILDDQGRPLAVTDRECPLCESRPSKTTLSPMYGDVNFHTCSKCKNPWATLVDESKLPRPYSPVSNIAAGVRVAHMKPVRVVIDHDPTND